MVTVELTNVQQVTRRSKGKAVEWETQKTIRKQATEWIQKANEQNVAEIQKQNTYSEEPGETTDNVRSCYL